MITHFKFETASAYSQASPAVGDPGADDFVCSHRFQGAVHPIAEVAAGLAWQFADPAAATAARPVSSFDLVAAVHVADKRYYDKLNAYFAARDLVLYELVTNGSSTDSARGMSESGLSVVGWLQVTAASLLGLRFQLDEIAYGASNFRHADLSISELQAIMTAKQENFFHAGCRHGLCSAGREQQARIREDLPASSFTTMALFSALSSEDRSQVVKYYWEKNWAEVAALRSIRPWNRNYTPGRPE